MRRMSWVLAILLLAISKTVVSQCDYIYVAEPPAGQLICDPFPINQLQLVCSIFVADVRQVPGDLIIQWFFSMPVNRQFSPANAVLLQQVRFPVVQQETFTSRIAVSSPPIGFYFCQPRLTIDGRPLIRSNVVPLQAPPFYQQRNIRQCLVNEFQNSSVPFCAVQGVALGPNQIIAPALASINVQNITPTAMNPVTPTAPLTLVPQPTPIVLANINDVTPDNGNNGGLIAGVVIAVVVIVATAAVVIVGLVVFYLIWKKKNDSKFPRTFNSRRLCNVNQQQRYAVPAVTTGQVEDVHDQESALITPPNKPPPRLRGFTNNRRRTTDHQYSRLKRSTPKAGKNNSRGRAATDSESTAYYITPDHDNDDRAPFYGEFNEEHTKRHYIDESESQVYTDPHYGAESDIHLQQQRKQQAFVRSSSLELESDEEGKRAREAASTVHAVNQMAHSRHNYQNCVPKGRYDNAVLSSTSEDADSTPYYQEIIATRELKTEYTSADILENTAL